jgi:mono/diheme cytochrome c family protein
VGEQPSLRVIAVFNAVCLGGTFEVMLGLAIVFLLLATSAGLAQDRKTTSLEQQGQALAERMCAACHAVGRRGNSPHVGAPPFRALDRRVDLDAFTDRMREGLTSDHPDMPMFRFTREDGSIQGQ